jgi:hypothetical protein
MSDDQADAVLYRIREARRGEASGVLLHNTLGRGCHFVHPAGRIPLAMAQCELT